MVTKRRSEGKGVNAVENAPDLAASQRQRKEPVRLGFLCSGSYSFFFPLPAATCELFTE
jgi:hypothetical protein